MYRERERMGYDTGVCGQINPWEKNTHGNMSCQSTKSGAGLQFLLWDCRARACAKGVFFTDTGTTRTSARFDNRFLHERAFSYNSSLLLSVVLLSLLLSLRLIS